MGDNRCDFELWKLKPTSVSVRLRAHARCIAANVCFEPIADQVSSIDLALASFLGQDRHTAMRNQNRTSKPNAVRSKAVMTWVRDSAAEAIAGVDVGFRVLGGSVGQQHAVRFIIGPRA